MRDRCAYAETPSHVEIITKKGIVSRVDPEKGILTLDNENEIFFSDNANDDRWYKVKLSFITIDEKTEKEKRSTVTYMVQALTFNGAVKNIEEAMGGTMLDYVIANISETKMMDVYEHAASTKQDKAADKPEYEQ